MGITHLSTELSVHTPHYQQDVPFEVPASWDIVSVSDLFLLNPKSELDGNMKVGFIPMALVEDGFSGNHFFEERTWKDVNRGYCHFQNGDIGVAKISPCFENRKSTIFNNLPNNYGAGTTELVILRPIKVYAKFYLYLFKSDWYLKEGTKYFKGVVGQQRVHKEIFTDLHIPLPPFAEQCRIVAEIERWFALIDQIEQDKSDLQTVIKQAKDKILDLAIHGKLVPQDPNDEPASELLKRINPKVEITCDNGHSGKLPQGWVWTTLGELYNIISAKRVLKSEWRNEGIPFYRAREIVKLSTTGFVDNGLFISQEHYSDLKMKYGVPQSSDIMMSAVGSIGKTYIVKSSDLFYYKDASVICLQNVHGLYSVFIDYVLRTSFLQKQMYTNSKGTTVDTITIEKAREYNIPLPPIAEQQRIVIKIEELFSVLDNIQNALEA